MAYEDTFYVVENIIGYSGPLYDHPTVYFRDGSGVGQSRNGSRSGHITQLHEIKENIGREHVMDDAGYTIENVVCPWDTEPPNLKGTVTCYEKWPHYRNPDGSVADHISRTPIKFLDSRPNKHVLAVLSQAIYLFPDEKALGTARTVTRQSAVRSQMMFQSLLQKHRDAIAAAAP